MKPDTAMIFAAGFGTRMRHLTAKRPKPLVPIAGVPMIDRALDLAKFAGVNTIVVNTHYLGQMLADHLAGDPVVHISPEHDRALETGGGLKRALPLLGREPVFTLNPDAVWTGGNPLVELAQNWMPDQMDALLLLVPVTRAIGHMTGGDFAMHPSGRLSRATTLDASAFVYTGVQILHTDGLADINKQVFSLNRLWDKMIARDRLFGCLYQGDWVSVGTPEGVDLANDHLKGIANV